MAWHEKILRVDLTKGTCQAEPLNMEWAAQYIGSRGLASKYLAAEMDPKADPLSPGNVLIFATGPLTGTSAATGGRYTVVTKGALTNAIACSNSGGYWGGELRLAGWDMVLVTGKSKKPVYLNIEDDKAELLDAKGFVWGQSVWQTEALIKERHQDPRIRVASIGRAGETLARYACIVNDLDRAAGRSGVGAVMGSKNLKAIAVRGTSGVQVKDADAFHAAVTAARAKLDPSDDRAGLAASGTISMLDITQSFGSLPTRNNRDVQFEGTDKIGAAAMVAKRRSDGQPNLIANKACFSCTIGCGRVSKMDPSHFAVKGNKRYKEASGGLEYESIYALGPMVGVDDIDAATYANYICNEEGMDPISFGSTLAAAMELYDVGAIGDKETGGLKLEFGSAEALVKGVELAGLGEGFGADLGLGAKLLCEKYGKPDLAMVVKGQEFPGYDGRSMQGMALAYATSNRGACHLKADPYGDDFDGGPIEGKAEIVYSSQNAVAAVDSSGLCLFPMAVWDLGDVASQLEAACGGGWTAERLAETGERIWNLERRFNLDAGLSAKDDTLPKRILKEALKSGSGKGKVAELDKMLPAYYEMRGWDDEGVPTTQTLQRLSML
ncbi:MAG: aldehyde ferredoxin oxidoreductase family protein [Rhodospirillaceae bacterium]|nr:aldehyde ferredoxin oxidoreductase family protein [Rhodospirillaceae bacterium]MBT5781375.1 aldehyde ferredoxin oxidoreductase family protein [Rhodospirillaceae bacterium]MBT7292776.1 aldehyde ferredoxin oxidoreductase family protein [Rhodospirillaceae bacterium]